GTGSAARNLPVGLAFDPVLNRLYWANSENENDATNAIGFVNLGSGSGGGITPAGVAVDHPQDPIVIKSPTVLDAPTITSPGTHLTCPKATGAAAPVPSFVYQAPRGSSYQWIPQDTPIDGATAATYTATASGRYKCIVTATNAVGSGSRISKGLVVTVTA